VEPGEISLGPVKKEDIIEPSNFISEPLEANDTVEKSRAGRKLKKTKRYDDGAAEECQESGQTAAKRKRTQIL